MFLKNVNFFAGVYQWSIHKKIPAASSRRGREEIVNILLTHKIMILSFKVDTTATTAGVVVAAFAAVGDIVVVVWRLRAFLLVGFRCP